MDHNATFQHGHFDEFVCLTFNCLSNCCYCLALHSRNSPCCRRVHVHGAHKSICRMADIETDRNFNQTTNLFVLVTIAAIQWLSFMKCFHIDRFFFVPCFDAAYTVELSRATECTAIHFWQIYGLRRLSAPTVVSFVLASGRHNNWLVLRLERCVFLGRIFYEFYARFLACQSSLQNQSVNQQQTDSCSAWASPNQMICWPSNLVAICINNFFRNCCAVILQRDQYPYP